MLERLFVGESATVVCPTGDSLRDLLPMEDLVSLRGANRRLRGLVLDPRRFDARRMSEWGPNDRIARLTCANRIDTSRFPSISDAIVILTRRVQELDVPGQLSALSVEGEAFGFSESSSLSRLRSLRIHGRVIEGCPAPTSLTHLCLTSVAEHGFPPWDFRSFPNLTSLEVRVGFIRYGEWLRILEFANLGRLSLTFQHRMTEGFSVAGLPSLRCLEMVFQQGRACFRGEWFPDRLEDLTIRALREIQLEDEACPPTLVRLRLHGLVCHMIRTRRAPFPELRVLEIGFDFDEGWADVLEDLPATCPRLETLTLEDCVDLSRAQSLRRLWLKTSGDTSNLPSSLISFRATSAELKSESNAMSDCGSLQEFRLADLFVEPGVTPFVGLYSLRSLVVDEVCTFHAFDIFPRTLHTLELRGVCTTADIRPGDLSTVLRTLVLEGLCSGHLHDGALPQSLIRLELRNLAFGLDCRKAVFPERLCILSFTSVRIVPEVDAFDRLRDLQWLTLPQSLKERVGLSSVLSSCVVRFEEVGHL